MDSCTFDLEYKFRLGVSLTCDLREDCHPFPGEEVIFIDICGAVRHLKCLLVTTFSPVEGHLISVDNFGLLC